MGKYSTSSKIGLSAQDQQLSEMIGRNQMDMARQWKQKASSSMTVNRPKSTTATFPMPPPGFFPNPDVSIGNAVWHANIPLPPPPPPPSSSQQSQVVPLMGSQMGANYRPPSREQSVSSWMTASRRNATATTTPIPMPPPEFSPNGYSPPPPPPSGSHPSQMVPMLGSQMAANHRQPSPKLLVPPMPDNLPLVAVNAYKEYGYFMYRANKALQVLQALGEHQRAPERTAEPEAEPEQQTGPSTSSSSSWNPHSISSQGQYRWVKKEEQPAQRQGYNAEPLVDLADDTPQRFFDPVEPSASANRPVEIQEPNSSTPAPLPIVRSPHSIKLSYPVDDDFTTMWERGDSEILREILKVVREFSITQEQLTFLTDTAHVATLKVLTTRTGWTPGKHKTKFVKFIMFAKNRPRKLWNIIERERRISHNLVFLPPFPGSPAHYPFSPEQVARLKTVARRNKCPNSWTTYKAIREVNGVLRANGPPFRAGKEEVGHWFKNWFRENPRNARPTE